MTVAASGFSGERVGELITYYENYADADAVITLDVLPDTEKKHEIPVIGLCSAPGADVILCSECETAIGRLISGFLASGAKKIGFIGEKHTVQKLSAFREALGDRLDPAFVSVTDERFERGGYLAADRLISSGCLPDALLCAYDYMAYGAMRRIRDEGLDIPTDIFVAGMDNLDESAYYIPSLTSVDMRSGDIAQLAADDLFRLISGEKADDVTLSAEIFLRESTGGVVI